MVRVAIHATRRPRRREKTKAHPTMKSQVEPGELTQRIRREARRHENIAFPPSAPPSANTGDALALPPAPVFAASQSGEFSCEYLLAHINHMVDRARGKTTVSKSVPKLLRPVYRNQGGYNEIVLAALDRLRELTRLLMAENAQLHLHIQRQTEWMQAVEKQFAKVEKRFDEIGSQPVPAEEVEGD